MNELMLLVIGWTIVGGFVVTMILTCLSLVGWVKFADKRQQSKLFSALIVEVVVGAGSWAAGGAKFDPEPVQKGLHQEGANMAIRDVVSASLEAGPNRAAMLDKSQLIWLVDRIQPSPKGEEGLQKEQLQTTIRALPEGKLHPETVKSLKNAAFLKKKSPGS